MQKGFASLEIIFALVIISILATVAVPKVAGFVDRAVLDYEQKRLYSELQFVRTLNRTDTILLTGLDATDFLTSEIKIDQQAALVIYRYNNSYQIRREEKPIRQAHHLSNGIKFSIESNMPSKIYFNSAGYSNVNSTSIILNSRRGRKAKIVFDSVGRLRGE